MLPFYVGLPFIYSNLSQDLVQHPKPSVAVILHDSMINDIWTITDLGIQLVTKHTWQSFVCMGLIDGAVTSSVRGLYDCNERVRITSQRESECN